MAKLISPQYLVKCPKCDTVDWEKAIMKTPGSVSKKNERYCIHCLKEVLYSEFIEVAKVTFKFNRKSNAIDIKAEKM